jgi:hypothetical protein
MLETVPQKTNPQIVNCVMEEKGRSSLSVGVCTPGANNSAVPWQRMKTSLHLVSDITMKTPIKSVLL